MNIFLIDGYETFPGVGEAKLNHSLVTTAKEYFEKQGHFVKTTCVEDGYNAIDEHEKLMWCDILFIQTPVYWFGIPGLFKSYIDRVLMVGYANGSTLVGDGRSREDTTKQYGSGGLLTNKKYMVSSIWNAPKEAFNNKQQFLEGFSPDQALTQLHKSYQFLGMKQIPSFEIYDVFKSLESVASQVESFKTHLEIHVPN